MTLCMSLLFVVLSGCGGVTQNEKDAVAALKKFEARVQTGINQPDYIAALGEAAYAVNMLESGETTKNKELDELIRSAMSDFKVAGEAWKMRVETTINPQEGVPGRIRLSDSAAQYIVGHAPFLGKPMSKELSAQYQKSSYTEALRQLVHEMNAPKPLTPKSGDGAVFVADGYATPPEPGVVIIGVKQVPVQYLSLEAAMRLLWIRAGESLAKAHAMTSK